MSGFVYKYGSYEHEVGSVEDFVWQRVPNITKRGHRDISLYRITLRGKFLGCSVSEIASQIDALTLAYAYSDKRFALVNPDGTDSPYVLDPAQDMDIMAGPYIADISYPKGRIEEMVLKREWRVVLECIRAEPDSEIIEYWERIKHVGNCMPSWVIQNVLSGNGRQYTTWNKTTQKIIQTGHSVGFEGYYCPGWNMGYETMGIPALDPSVYEHKERRLETPGKPLHLGSYFVYYPADWTYVYESVQPFFVTPA